MKSISNDLNWSRNNQKWMLSFLLILSFSLIGKSASSQQAKISFNKDWKFYLGDDSSAKLLNFSDASWRKLNLPHDWSIEGNFSEKNPTTFNEGALPAGVGWYRKTFVVPPSSKNKITSIIFDGVYCNSEVWINGHYLGKRPNGYISFQYDLTPYLKFGGEKNLVAVRVDNSRQPNSRWYTGSGIYRNVWIETTSQLFVDRKSLFVRTRKTNAHEANIDLTFTTSNKTGKRQDYKVLYQVFDGLGKLVLKKDDLTSRYSIDIAGPHSFTTNIFDVKLWSPASPNLYKIVVKIIQDKKVVDATEVVFGFRYFDFDAAKGFSFNGEPLKILGVCMHHDLGALGAAVNKSAIKRQLQLLKDMGCNAIRTAHNPPAPEFLDLCDQMGFLVMDEAFDMWKKKKNKFDYSVDFNEWHERDVTDWVYRDRNHASVFMWSIGNEIREQFDSSGTRIAKELTQLIKRIDSTRPVTSALTENFPGKNFIYQSGSLDVLGFNYKHADYDELPKRFPNQKFIASETASALATRGYYEMPSDSFRIWPPDAKSTTHGNADKTVSAYDNTFAYWGGTHEQTWKAVKDRPFMSGIFVWSGFDFLGEPVPYQWPARSSYYGIIDLAGFPKDVYYLYQSEWSGKPVLHIFPHWNWEPGQLVDVWAYFNNADEVELYLNGRSLGIRKKDTGNLHVIWKVPFEAGTLKAVSRKNGKIVLIKEMRTAGKPAKILLTADRTQVLSTGDELVFITLKIADAQGNLVPDANRVVNFSINDIGTIVAVDNGLQTSMEPFQSSSRTTFNGLCMAVVRPNGKKGDIVIKASTPGIQAAALKINSF